ALDLAAHGHGEGLMTVADAEDGDGELVEQGLLHLGRALVIERRGPAGQDDPARIAGKEGSRLLPTGDDAAEDAHGANAPGNELCVLGTVIDDGDHGRCRDFLPWVCEQRRSTNGSGIQPSACRRSPTRGDAPGWQEFAPSALGPE